MEQIIILSLLVLIGSIVLNLFMFWYNRNLLRELLDVSENMLDLKNELDSFEEHIKSVYELETFYGDETLHALLKHAMGVCDILEDFSSIYELISEPKDEEENAIDGRIEHTDTGEEDSQGQETQEEILHPRTRGSHSKIRGVL